MKFAVSTLVAVIVSFFLSAAVNAEVVCAEGIKDIMVVDSIEYTLCDIPAADEIMDDAATGVSVTEISTPVMQGDMQDCEVVVSRSDNPNWWWNRLRHGTLQMNDTSVIYPRFLGFCVNVYNWADRAFNYYDPDYVQGTGRRWKARLVNENWLD